MDFSRQVNYQSDFDVLLHLIDADGNDVGYPDFDFTAKFSSGGSYEVGQKNCVKRGVAEADGNVKVVFDSHKLSPGELKLTFTADVPNEDYPDGKKLHVIPVKTDIFLTSEVSEVSTGIVIDVKLPFSVSPEGDAPQIEDDGE